MARTLLSTLIPVSSNKEQEKKMTENAHTFDTVALCESTGVLVAGG
jgi:hypothetical protein